MRLGYVLFGLAFVGAAATYGYLRPVGIVVAADHGDDLCGAYGVVKDGPASSQALKARPSVFSRTVAHVAAGTGVIMCSDSNGWSGVVVPEEGRACIDRENQNARRTYDGPCVSGWLQSDRIELFAG